jgi:hypothetical protein
MQEKNFEKSLDFCGGVDAGRGNIERQFRYRSLVNLCLLLWRCHCERSVMKIPPSEWFAYIKWRIRRLFSKQRYEA